MAFIDLKSKTSNPYYPEVLDVDPKEVLDHTRDLALIDVRQPDEYTGELGHIEGARLVVLDSLPEHIASLPKDKTVVFVCRSGGRSARAAAFAAQSGMKNIFNMKGGMLLWNDLKLPTTK